MQRKSNQKPNNPSKEYQAAYQLIHGVDVVEELNQVKDDEKDKFFIVTNNIDKQEPTVNTDKWAVEERIRALDKAIAKVDKAIGNIRAEEAEESLSCFLGGLFMIGGAVSLGAGISDIGHGDVGVGTLEVMSGMLSMDVGDSYINDASTAIQELSQPLSRLETVRNELRKERTEKRKELYQIEKEETLHILNPQANQINKESSPSPLFLAVKNQFDAIDLDIDQGKFSKTYIEVAKNTKRIITAPNQQKRNEYADKHVTIVTKQSISKVVGGCMLMLVGVAAVITSAVLTAFFIESGPIAIIGGALGILSGLGMVAKGGLLIQSGMSRNRTPLLAQSLFNVVDKAKTAPETNPSNRYGNF